MKHLKVFETQNNYSGFKSSNEYVEPNVSFISEDGVVYFNPVDNSMKVFCTFNATSDKNKAIYSTNNIKSLKINGELINIDGMSEYHFTTEGVYNVEIEILQPGIDGIFTDGNPYVGNSCITSLEIPSSIERLDVTVISKASLLKELTIGEGCKYIGDNVFYYAPIEKITCYAKQAPELGYEPFAYHSYNGVLRVPKGSDYSSWISKLGYDRWTVEYI